MKRSDFGSEFHWGVTISAFQNEGFATADGKSESIWDRFTSIPSNIRNGELPGNTTEFYTRYEEDIRLAKKLNFNTFRFSLAWTRILPNGTGWINQKGIEFYNRVIDCCLKHGIEPWITLYHWDLPQNLEEKGGWTNRESIEWFTHYAGVCAHFFGNRVKYWIIMNEPMSFTGLGYYMGYHAPGRKGLPNFLSAVHHVCMAMSEAGRKIREMLPQAQIGPALSCSCVEPFNRQKKHQKAAQRLEVLLNRIYLDPFLGMGYPSDLLPALKLINPYIWEGDLAKLPFQFDFIGIQYYFRVVARYSLTNPGLFAEEVPPPERKSMLNQMNLDAYHKGLKKVLEFYNQYPNLPPIIVTESGTCVKDELNDGKITDTERMRYHQKMIAQIHKAKKAGINVRGYLVWTLTDNFEWSEGYHPKFGLVHVDRLTQKRIPKKSALWIRKFLAK